MIEWSLSLIPFFCWFCSLPLHTCHGVILKQLNTFVWCSHSHYHVHHSTHRVTCKATSFQCQYASPRHRFNLCPCQLRKGYFLPKQQINSSYSSHHTKCYIPLTLFGKFLDPISFYKRMKMIYGYYFGFYKIMKLIYLVKIRLLNYIL